MAQIFRLNMRSACGLALLRYAITARQVRSIRGANAVFYKRRRNNLHAVLSGCQQPSFPAEASLAA